MALTLVLLVQPCAMRMGAAVDFGGNNGAARYQCLFISDNVWGAFSRGILPANQNKTQFLSKKEGDKEGEKGRRSLEGGSIFLGWTRRDNDLEGGQKHSISLLLSTLLQCWSRGWEISSKEGRRSTKGDTCGQAVNDFVLEMKKNWLLKGEWLGSNPMMVE
ncbi:hypothetical protein GOP47_0001433 [Adiantum capillus-veneris]|uniref:Uncharacterized protein n=1 Tax=Adiantum capillus-veneris TaxID=13818 RepID=A0A9D4V889_ADICA|nr:hypothetical protein GOP47_0001433 [Adiantum capillus-veneris]